MSTEEQLKEALQRAYILKEEIDRFVSEQDKINAKLIEQIKLLNEETDLKINGSYRSLFPAAKEGKQP